MNKRLRNLAINIAEIVGNFFKIKTDYLVLTYHDVGGDINDPFSIEYKIFKKHMEILKTSGKEIISLTELYHRIIKNEDTSNCVVITFDDGFKNHLKLVAPLLKEFNYPACFFVNIEPKYNIDKYLNRKFLSKEEILELHNMGFEIGNHTYSHKYLPRLPDKDIEDEIKKCDDILKKLLKKKIIHFCPPGGGYNNHVYKTCRDLGYKTISIGTNIYKSLDDSVIVIDRRSVHYLNEKQFKKLINGKLEIIYWGYKKFLKYKKDIRNRT